MTTSTVQAWLAARDGASPEGLTARVRALAADAAQATGADAPAADVLLAATAAVLARLLRDHETARTSALELLAADALATYAMEALGETPDVLEVRCSDAMRRFAELADSA